MPEPTKPQKYLSFDFYKIDPFEGGKPFDELLKEAQKVADFKDRIVLKAQTPIRWEFLEERGDGLWVGDITRIRDDVIPNKAARARARERLKVAEDEGTTEDTIFGYNATNGVLICHSNRFGVTAYDIADYFTKLCKASQPLSVSLILTPEGIAALNDFQYFDKFLFKVARPTKGPTPKTGERSVDTVMDNAAHLQAKYCEVVYSVGRAKQKMIPLVVSKAASGLMKIFGDRNRPVRKLQVTGMTADGRHDSFDLLENRLRTRKPVTVTPDRDMPYVARREALETAYVACSTVLDALFEKKVNGDSEN